MNLRSGATKTCAAPMWPAPHLSEIMWPMQLLFEKSSPDSDRLDFRWNLFGQQRSRTAFR
jgi:hypothetical protein